MHVPRFCRPLLPGSCPLPRACRARTRHDPGTAVPAPSLAAGGFRRPPGHVTTSARVSPHPAASFPIRAAQLVRGNTGWVLTTGALSMTSNGGQTWSAGPPDPGFADTDSAHVDFADKQHGWVVVTLPGSPQRCCPGDEPGTLR